MRGPTHALGGAATAAIFLAVPSLQTTPILLLSILGAFAALVPDLDNSESTLENLRVGGVRIFKCPAFIIDKMFKHRGYLHSLLALALLSFVLLGFLPMLPKDVVIVILLGYLSHIALDSLTPVGIPWLYPLEHNFRLLPKILCITTGSIAEMAFFVVLVVLYAMFLESAHFITLP
jgi:inner membrane protein